MPLESLSKQLADKIASSENSKEEIAQFLINNFSTSNVYVDESVLAATIHSNRGDGTESIILIAPHNANDCGANIYSISLLLAMASHLKGLPWWSKDIIILIPATDEKSSMPALEKWLNQYFGASKSSRKISTSIPQIGIVLEDALGNCAPSSDTIIFDGAQGLLPNLDLLNTFVTISKNHHLEPHLGNANSDTPIIAELQKRLKIMSRFWTASKNDFSSGHGVLLKNRIDAFTLKLCQAHKSKINRVEILESSLRSYNNILEHLHQSFNFYFLLDRDNFYSIATYIAAGALPIAALFTRYRGLRNSDEDSGKNWCLSFLVVFLSCLVEYLRMVFTTSALVGKFLILAFLIFLLVVVFYHKVEIPCARSSNYLFMALSLSKLLFANFGKSFFLGSTLCSTLILCENKKKLTPPAFFLFGSFILSDSMFDYFYSDFLARTSILLCSWEMCCAAWDKK